MEVFDLDGALEAHPLPEGIEDAVLNRAQLSHAMNTSENTISKWVTSGMPVIEEGGNGKEYAFQLSHCYAWRMQKEAAQADEKRIADEAAAKMRFEFLNSDDEAAEERALSPREIREMAEAEIVRMKAAQQRGELVRAARVRETIEDVFASVRNATTTLPDYAEMEFGLSPVDVEKLQKRCDQMLSDLRHKIENDLAQPGQIAILSASNDA